MSTISATSSTPSIASTSDAGQQQKIQKDLAALANALKKKDTQAAEAAMMQLQVDSTSTSSSGSPANRQAVSDLSKVASALNSGDVSGAQNAFATFEKNASAYASSGSSSSANPSTSQATTDADFLDGLAFTGATSSGKLNVTV